MVISFRKVKRWAKFFLLFTLFTLLLYQVFSVLAPFFKPDFLYEEPSEGAVKVIAQENADHEPVSAFEEMKERLLIFYWMGE
ncbi:DUF4227 family protein [Thermoactinomyces mirandus]|uniref:DUF4227 family protein n=1 Tax=Thermoactinomyces mirandus TaxID=2756294 RepID=A0A7W1XPL6_9BACL|nr:DUF4227 family protein [Thermoactinomyces mirandus]MBA4600954.1 DUF4227 family protein [Thermoactinomyces mirandus]